ESGDLTPEAAAEILRRPILAGDESPWLDTQRARARKALVATLHRIGSVAALEEAVELEPFDETLHRGLIELHLSNGNRGEALRAFERCKRLLDEELGVAPSDETEALYQKALGGESAPVERGIVCLLFTDLVGSTELIERLGDERAEQLRRTHLRLLRDA